MNLYDIGYDSYKWKLKSLSAVSTEDFKSQNYKIMEEYKEIVVIGSGPTGLGAAPRLNQLAEQGMRKL